MRFTNAITGLVFTLLTSVSALAANVTPSTIANPDDSGDTNPSHIANTLNATCDYQTGSGGSITASSNQFNGGSTTFAARDIGKKIEITGAGSNGLPLVATITAVNGSTATLNTTASRNASSSVRNASAWAVVVAGGDGSHSYAVGDTLTLSGGVGTSATTLQVKQLQVVGTPTIAAAGSGGTNGTFNAIGTTGTGQKFIVNITVSGGAVSAVNSLMFSGVYTTAPTSQSSEPLASDNKDFTIPTGAAVALPSMGVQGATLVNLGSYTTSPVGGFSGTASTTSSGSGQGATLSMTFPQAGGFGYGTDTASSINTALAAAPSNGGTVALPSGTCLIGQKLIFLSNTKIQGQGIQTTTLRLLAGVNDTVLEGSNFSSLTGGNTATGVADFDISNLSIDANAVGNLSPGSNAGHGIAFYGRQFLVHDVYITNTRRTGLWSEYASGSGGTSPYDGHVSHLTTDTTGEHGWSNGVSDLHADDLNIRYPGQSMTASFDGVSAATRSIRGSNINVWGSFTVNHHRYGAYLGNGSKVSNIHVETAQIADLFVTDNYSSVNGILAYNLADPTTAGMVGVPVAIMVGGSGNDLTGTAEIASGTSAAIGLRLGDFAGNTAFGNHINAYITGFASGLIDFSGINGSNTITGTDFLNSGTANIASPTSNDTVQLIPGGGAGYAGNRISSAQGFLSGGFTQLGTKGQHNVSLNGGFADGSYTAVAPTSGGSAVIGSITSTYHMDPAAAINSYSLTMPTDPTVDGFLLTISTSQPIYNFTLSPNTSQTLATAAPTVLPAGSSLTYLWKSASKIWVLRRDPALAAPQPNILINPLHVIDQRHEGASTNSNDGNYLDDGWKVRKVLAGGATVSAAQAQIADAPTGYKYSDRLTIGTGASLSSTDWLAIGQNIEGLLFNDNPWGVSGATNMAITAYIKTSVSNAVVDVAVLNSGNNRSYAHDCQLSGTGWNICQFVVPADTSGTWLTGLGNIGARLYIVAGCGSSFQTTADTWSAGNLPCTSNQTNITSTSSATFQIGPVKAEFSPVPTPLRIYDFTKDYLSARRFYKKTFPWGTAPAQSAGLGGAVCIKASAAAAGAIGYQWLFDPPMVNGTYTVTTYNPSANDANWRDTTTTSTTLTVSTDPATAKSAGGYFITSSTAPAAGDVACIHASFDPVF